MRSADGQDWIHFDYTNYRQENIHWSMESQSFDTVTYSPASPLLRTKLRVYNSGKNLSRITVSSQQTVVDFNAALTPRNDVTSNTFTQVRDNYPLGEINVTNARGRTIKHWEMTYDYSTSRLTLKTLTEKIGNTAKPPYKFDYSGSLPETTSFARDHWGFLNNNSSNTMIPSTRVHRKSDNKYRYIRLSGANRKPSGTGALAGLLTSITYPTGGKDAFTFEVHDYSFLQRQEITRPITTPKNVEASLPNGDDDYQLEFRTFTLTGTTDVGFMAQAAFGHSGGGNYFGSVLISNSRGETILSLAPTGRPNPDTSSGEYWLFDTLYQLPPDTYSLSVTMRLAPGPRKNTLYIKLDWEEETGRQAAIVKGGGARIARIVRSFNNGSPENITKYEYRHTEGGMTRSTGSMLETEQVYEFETDFARQLTPYTFYTERRLMRFSQNRCTLGSAPGSRVGYNLVTVWHGEHGENGRSVYRYSSPRDVPDLERNYLPFPPGESADHARGLLQLRSDFGADDADTVKSIGNTYTTIDHVIPGLKIGWYVAGANVRGPDLLGLYALGNYTTRLGYARLINTRERQLQPGAPPLNTYTQNQYDETTHKQLVMSTTILSTGDTIVSYTKYPKDYTSGPGISTLQSLHIDNVPIERLTWRQKPGGKALLLSGTKTDYSPSNGGVVPVARYGARISSALPTIDPFATVQGLYEKRLVLSSYDSKNNLREHALSDDVKYTYQWDYAGTLPTAKAQNASAGQIFFQSFEEDVTAVTTQKRTGRKSLSLNGTYSVPAVNCPNANGNYILSYWTKSGNQPWVYQEKRFTGYTAGGAMATDAVTGFIDDVRVYPENALMTTYTYEPGVGITSITDPANLTVYYEYDSLNRLLSIRDHNGNLVESYNYQFQISIPYEVQE